MASAEIRIKRWCYQMDHVADFLRLELQHWENLATLDDAYIRERANAPRLGITTPSLASPLKYNWTGTDLQLYDRVESAIDTWKHGNGNYINALDLGSAQFPVEYQQRLRMATQTTLQSADKSSPMADLFADIFEKAPPPAEVLAKAISECKSYHENVDFVEQKAQELEKLDRKVIAVIQAYKQQYGTTDNAYANDGLKYRVHGLDLDKQQLDEMCHLLSVAFQPVRSAVLTAMTGSMLDDDPNHIHKRCRRR